jgi:hypothetical protein
VQTGLSLTELVVFQTDLILALADLFHRGVLLDNPESGAGGVER